MLRATVRHAISLLTECGALQWGVADVLQQVAGNGQPVRPKKTRYRTNTPPAQTVSCEVMSASVPASVPRRQTVHPKCASSRDSQMRTPAGLAFADYVSQVLVRASKPRHPHDATHLSGLRWNAPTLRLEVGCQTPKSKLRKTSCDSDTARGTRCWHSQAPGSDRNGLHINPHW